MENFSTQGVCAQKFSFQIENNCLVHVEFQGGCNGNLKGICNLVEGMPVAEVIKRQLWNKI